MTSMWSHRCHPDVEVQGKRQRVEDMNYLGKTLRPEDAAKVLSMLSLQDVLALSGCNWQLRCWLSPSEPILKLLDVTLPPNHLLKNILLIMAGASEFLSLKVLKEIRHWSCRSTLHFTDFKPVQRWSHGNHPEAQEVLRVVIAQRLQGHSVENNCSMEEAVKKASLSSTSCSAMAHQVMRQTCFTCSPALAQKIRSITDSIGTSFQWPCCNFTSISSTYEIDDGHAGGGFADEALTVILEKDGLLIQMDVLYSCVDVENGFMLAEESGILCQVMSHGMRTERLFEISNVFRFPNRDIQRDVQTNVEMLKMVGIQLLGQEVDTSLTLHLLWRLLCAPLVIWPFKTHSNFFISSNHVMSDLQLPGTSIRDCEWIPVTLRARSMFEKVAHHICGVHVDLMDVRVSSSPFDDKEFLDEMVKVFQT